jgi:glutamate--cysteine ligase
LAALRNRLAALPNDALCVAARRREGEPAGRLDGRLATTPHPAALGAALTHPHITTDFSEAQLELITGVHPNAEARVRELAEIHQFVYRHLGDEMMSSSMPLRRPTTTYPGQYGTSNVGRLKTVYRMGLSLRYGRRMQTISGVHYNFSLPELALASLQGVAVGAMREARTAGYFALIRNFRRHGCCCTCSARRRPCARSSPGASIDCSCRTTRCTCHTRRRCAWARSATRATRSAARRQLQ